ncbi:aldo-keto reductase AKR2E4-like isoform X2 [Leptopilina heterotoma]|uniref:aldo-keto reductase AKR2E4-like isoform X2 n=1 Tax=Leptopilina heterotoma TaxID=63436 RepID=UPI001CA8F241|nr:aldo-keto reductase AKR2E4-like isoform X2 [Leptopilina heterotoma]
MSVPSITLNNGSKVPVLGLGTWQGVDSPSEVESAVRLAIDIGYRHFDCAAVYGNEREIGKVLREKIADGTVKREDLFIVTKVWNDDHKEQEVVKACKDSLKKFGLDYIDLYLIHWPVSDSDDVDYIETWRGMEKCVELKLTKNIGLSNFNAEQIRRILAVAKIKPVMNQVECHVNLVQKKLRDLCREYSIEITSYSPFGAPNTPGSNSGFKSVEKVTLDAPILLKLAEKYNKTKFQIALRFLVDIGTIPIPKSSTEKNLKANFDIFDFKLTAEEIIEIEKLDSGKRTCPAVQYKGFKYYPFDDEF